MARRKPSAASNSPTPPPYHAFTHPEADNPMRPDIGAQASFKKKKPPATYRFDSSLPTSLQWYGQNPARELGEWLIACAQEAAAL